MPPRPALFVKSAFRCLFFSPHLVPDPTSCAHFPQLVIKLSYSKGSRSKGTNRVRRNDRLGLRNGLIKQDGLITQDERKNLSTHLLLRMLHLVIELGPKNKAAILFFAVLTTGLILEDRRLGRLEEPGAGDPLGGPLLVKTFFFESKKGNREHKPRSLSHKPLVRQGIRR